MTLGQVLKEARLASGMSLRDLAGKAKISNGYISLLESDSVGQVSPRHLHSLSKVLGIEYEQLMHLAGYVAPEVVQPIPSPGLQGLGEDLGDLTESERREVSAFVRGLRASRARLNRK